MRFLGTGAAELYPNPFCGCEVCVHARESGDPKLIRQHSSFLLDEENLIDFGPGVMDSCNRHGVSLQRLRNVFITHMHEDHFSFNNFGFMEMSVTPTQALTVYLSAAAHKDFLRLLEQIPSLGIRSLSWHALYAKEAVRYIPVNPYTEFQVGDMSVYSIEGFHKGFFNEEKALNYVFTIEGKKTLYACDTGKYGSEQLEGLRDIVLDRAIFDGNFGDRETEYSAGHMNRVTLCETLDALIAQGTVTPATQLYITHVGHKGRWNLYDYQKYMREIYGERITVAYDGLRIP